MYLDMSNQSFRVIWVHHKKVLSHISDSFLHYPSARLSFLTDTSEYRICHHSWQWQRVSSEGNDTALSSFITLVQRAAQGMGVSGCKKFRLNEN